MVIHLSTMVIHKLVGMSNINLHNNITIIINNLLINSKNFYNLA